MIIDDREVSPVGTPEKFEIIRICAVTEFFQNPDEYLKNADAVITRVHGGARDRILRECVEREIEVFLIPSAEDILFSGAKAVPFTGQTGQIALKIKNPRFSRAFRFVKRCFDVIASASALVILSPLMAVVALVVRADGGPAIYRQARLTRDGVVFQILKFRSMTPERENINQDINLSNARGGVPDWTRVTRVGQVLRKYHIDELPQLINIFRGDMTFVGPRPERPALAAEYERRLPEFALRLNVKAGLTGYAQIRGGYDTPPERKILMDLWYITHANIFMDINILFSTLFMILRGGDPVSESGCSVNLNHRAILYKKTGRRAVSYENGNGKELGKETAGPGET